MRRLQRDRKAEAVAETLKFMLAWFCAGLAIVGILPGDMDCIATMCLIFLSFLVLNWFQPSARIVRACAWAALVLSTYRLLFAVDAAAKAVGVKERMASIRMLYLLAFGLLVEESQAYYAAFATFAALAVVRSVDFDPQVAAVTLVAAVTFQCLFAFKCAREAREERRLARLRAESAQRASKSLRDLAGFQRAIDVAGKGVMIAAAGSRKILHVNRTWCVLTGHEKDEVVGRTDFVARCCCRGPHTDPRKLDALDRAVAEERAFTAEMRGAKMDGEEFWIELTVRPVEDGRGCVEQFVATLDDVTEKVRQTRVIAEQKKFIGDQARATADSAMGAARTLAQAKAVIASQSAETAMLKDTIERMREQLLLSKLLREQETRQRMQLQGLWADGEGPDDLEDDEETTGSNYSSDSQFGSLHLTPPGSASSSHSSTSIASASSASNARSRSPASLGTKQAAANAAAYVEAAVATLEAGAHA